MARGRMISKSLSTSERFQALHDVAGKFAEFCQLLYALMVPHTDDFGRMQGDAKTIKLQVIPGSPRKVPEFQAALLNLEAVGLIQLYTGGPDDDRRIYLQVSKFDEHQSGLHKRTKSRFPDPPAVSRKPRVIPGQENLTEFKKNRTELKDQIVPEIDPADTWSRVLAILPVSEHAKQAFFAVCRQIRETDGLLEIGAPNKTVAEFLRLQYRGVLETAMKIVCPDLGLSIVVQKAAPSKAEDEKAS